MGLPKKPLDRYQQMALEVDRYVRVPIAANLQKLQQLLAKLPGPEVKKLEEWYKHQTGANLTERMDPRLLRVRIRKYWANTAFKEKAEELLKLLESRNPLERTSSTICGLTSAQLTTARASAQALKGKWHQALVPPELLGQWLFRDGVWQALCQAGQGGGISYTKYAIGGQVSTPLFRSPTDDEVKRWEKGASDNYLRDIALNIDKQLNWFSTDIGWFMGGRGTVMAGDGVLAGSKAVIRSYQASWERLGSATKTLDFLKNQLLLPNSTFMKYLWSEKTRCELRLWRESKSG